MHQDATASEKYYNRLKQYLEESDVGHQMVEPLKKGCVVYTDIEKDNRKYELVKIKNRCELRLRESRHAELQFKFTHSSIDYLTEPPPENIHEMMNRFFDCLLEEDETKKAELIFRTNIFEIIRKGYLSLLLLGGQRAVPTLVSIGVELPHWLTKNIRHHKQH